MERLTSRDSLGRLLWPHNSNGEPCMIDEIHGRLEEYELTGLTPEEIKDMSEQLGDFASWSVSTGIELKNYKDAEEQGLLTRLPCKVGDTVYTIGENTAPCEKCVHGEEVHNDVMECLECHKDYECPAPERFIEERICNGFEIGSGGIELVEEWGYDMKHIFKPYHLARESAEEALKGGEVE